MNNVKLDILNKIKSGELEMKPRWHFMLKSLLIVFGIIVVTLVAVYLLSFIFFVLRQSGVGFAPMYGFGGLMIFVTNSPWLLISSVGMFVAVLYLLVVRYSFSYEKPLIYSMLSVVLLVLAVSFLLHEAGFHQHLQRYSMGHNTPGLASLYRGYAEGHPENVTIGEILSVSEKSFEIKNNQGEVLSVIVTPDTRPRRGISLVIGQNVFVFGEREGDFITAFGIRPAQVSPLGVDYEKNCLKSE